MWLGARADIGCCLDDGSVVACCCNNVARVPSVPKSPPAHAGPCLQEPEEALGRADLIIADAAALPGLFAAHARALCAPASCTACHTSLGLSHHCHSPSRCCALRVPLVSRATGWCLLVMPCGAC